MDYLTPDKRTFRKSGLKERVGIISDRDGSIWRVLLADGAVMVGYV